MADINITDIVKEKIGIDDTSAEGLIETAQQKLDDGTIDETLEKIGVKDTTKWTGIIKGCLSLFTSLRSIFGKKQEEVEEEEEETEEEEEEEEEA